VFMNTGMYDLTLNDEGTKTYRITPADLDQMVLWQNQLVARMPAGSTFVTTFPFNGETIQEKGGYAADALYLHAKEVRDEFFWESHTWDHPELTDLTYDEVYEEYHHNIETSDLLFNNQSASAPNYCKNSVITPSITGLFNGDALQAMWDLGIRNLCGDNSHPEQLPAFDYHGWYTNETYNGFDGMYIVPRVDTNIYYDASQTINIVQQYNHNHNATWTFDQIIAYEADYNSRLLLQYRHDPYMFHQANMRTITNDGQTTSLLASWVDAVVDEVLKYSTLPLTSHTHDDLAVMLQAREARDACGFTARLRIDQTGHITGFGAKSTGTCEFAVSGAQTAPSTGVTFETVGEEKTIWIEMEPNTPVEIAFSTPISL